MQLFMMLLVLSFSFSLNGSQYIGDLARSLMGNSLLQPLLLLGQEKKHPEDEKVCKAVQKYLNKEALVWIKTTDGSSVQLDITHLLGSKLIHFIKGMRFFHLYTEYNPLPTRFSDEDIKVLNMQVDPVTFAEIKNGIIKEDVLTYNKFVELIDTFISKIDDNNLLPREVDKKIISYSSLFTGLHKGALCNKLMNLGLFLKIVHRQDKEKPSNEQLYEIAQNSSYRIERGDYIKSRYGYPYYIYTIDSDGKKAWQAEIICKDRHSLLLPDKNLLLYTNVTAHGYFTKSYSPDSYLYDIRNNKHIHLPVALANKAVCETSNSSTISSDENFIVGCSFDNFIYVINIKDLDNIRYKRLLHPRATEFVFNQDSTLLVSGVHDDNYYGGPLELWNLNIINWEDDSDVNPITLNDNIDVYNMYFSQDKNYMRVVDYRGRGSDLKDFVININDPKIIQKFSSSSVSFFINEEGKKNQFVDWIAYYTDYEHHELSVYKDNGGKPICSMIADKLGGCCNGSHPCSFLLSKNLLFCAPTDRNLGPNFHAGVYVLRYSQDQQRFIPVSEKRFVGACTRLNDDGSFELQNSGSIEFYNADQECYLRLDAKPFCSSLSSFGKQFRRKNNEIIFSDTYSSKAPRVTYPLPTPEELSAIQGTISDLNLKEYLFLQKAMTYYSVYQTKMPINQNSNDSKWYDECNKDSDKQKLFALVCDKQVIN